MTTVAPDTAATIALERAMAGERLTDADALALLQSNDLVRVGAAARAVRERVTDPDAVTFIIDRNVNYTNFCVTDCDFCAFYRHPRDPEGYVLPEVGDLPEDRGDARARRHGAAAARRPPPGPAHRLLRGSVPLDQGALPDPPACPLAVRGPAHRPLLQALARGHNHAIAPCAGLDSIPGGGAEILVDRVREIIAPRKTTTAEWLGVMREAHRHGHVDLSHDDVRHRRYGSRTGSSTCAACANCRTSSRAFARSCRWSYQSRRTAPSAVTTTSTPPRRLPDDGRRRPALPRQLRRTCSRRGSPRGCASASSRSSSAATTWARS